MKKTIKFAFAAIALGALPSVAFAEADCVKIAAVVKQSVAADTSKVLEVVQQQVSANPKCACEVVKTAIQATSAKPELVASIVETASNAAPEQMRLVAQCAVAVAPDSLNKVQAVLAKLDPGTGPSSSSKDGKGGLEKAPITEEAALANPLDFPGSFPGSNATVGQPRPIFNPPVVNTPEGTEIDFSEQPE